MPSRLLTNPNQQFNCSPLARRMGGFFIPIKDYIYLQIIDCTPVQIDVYDYDTGLIIPFITAYQYVTGIVNGVQITNIRIPYTPVFPTCFYFIINCLEAVYYTEVYKSVDKMQLSECQNFVEFVSEYPCYDIQDSSEEDFYYGQIPNPTSGTMPTLQYSNIMYLAGELSWLKKVIDNNFEGINNYQLSTKQKSIYRFATDLLLPEWYAQLLATVLGGKNLLINAKSYFTEAVTIEKSLKTCLTHVDIELVRMSRTVFMACNTVCTPSQDDIIGCDLVQYISALVIKTSVQIDNVLAHSLSFVGFYLTNQVTFDYALVKNGVLVQSASNLPYDQNLTVLLPLQGGDYCIYFRINKIGCPSLCYSICYAIIVGVTAQQTIPLVLSVSCNCITALLLQANGHIHATTTGPIEVSGDYSTTVLHVFDSTIPNSCQGNVTYSWYYLGALVHTQILPFSTSSLLDTESWGFSLETEYELYVSLTCGGCATICIHYQFTIPMIEGTGLMYDFNKIDNNCAP